MRKTYLTCIAALSMLLVVACVKEDIKSSSSSAETDDYLTVADAQMFFEKEITRSLATRSSAKAAGLTPGEFTPDWTRAKTSQNEEIGSVDIPINTQYIYRAVRSELKNGKASVYQVALSQKLVVEKNKQNGRLSCFVLTLLPDKEFYSKNKDNISNRFINSGEKGRFTGICVYSSFRSNIAVRMDRYVDGKMTEHLDLSRSINDPMDIHTSKINNFLGGIRIYRQIKVSTRSGGEDDNSCAGCDGSGCSFCIFFGNDNWGNDNEENGDNNEEDGQCIWCNGRDSGCAVCSPTLGYCPFCSGLGCHMCNGKGDDYCSTCCRYPCSCSGDDSYDDPLVPILHDKCRTLCGWISMDDDPYVAPIRYYCPKCSVYFWY